MDREEVRKEALGFLRDELRLVGLSKRRQQENWYDANRKLASASAGIKSWQFWRMIQQKIGVRTMARADSERWHLAFREGAIQHAIDILGAGYAPDERILDLFQEIANEAQVALKNFSRVVGIESNRIAERARTTHRLVNELRDQHRGAYRPYAA